MATDYPPYTVPPNPNASSGIPADPSIPTQTPINDFEAISIYEMLGAIYSSDYYLAMDDIGSRIITIGQLGSPNQGGLRISVNTYITTNLGNTQIYALRQYICVWDKIKLSNIQISAGNIGEAISGLSASPEEKVSKLLRLVKTLLPAITPNEYAQRKANGGVIDSYGGGKANNQSGSGFNVPIMI